MGTTYSIFNQSLVTATTLTTAANVGTEFTIDRTCWAVGFTFRRPDNTAQAAPTAKLFNQSNNNGASTVWSSVASATFGTLSANAGWKTVMLATPVRLAYNATSYRNRYRVSIRATRYCQTASYWTTGPGSAGLTSGPMTAPSRANAFLNAQSSSGGATIDDAPTTASSSGQNWWADILISDVDPRMRSNMTTLFGGD